MMLPFTAADSAFMRRALSLAERGLYTTQPNPRVGCVLVKDSQIIGEGFHARVGEPHAEVHALRAAGRAAQGATAYVTLEPCSHYGRTPPCANALVEAGVTRVVAAMTDPNPLVAGQGLARLQAAGVSTNVGLLEAEARALNPGFISAMERQRPFVRLKMAMSLDGRTAMRSGESQWITGEAARRDGQYWRARAGAILTGIGTVLADDPSLNVRLSAAELGIEGGVRQPVRVILDSQLRLSPTAQILQQTGEIWVMTLNADPTKQAMLQVAGAKVCQLSANAEGQVDLSAVLQMLWAAQVYEIHVEAGAQLAGKLMAAGLVDEILLYVAPCLLGSDARPLLALPLTQMSDKIQLQIQSLQAVGDDWRYIAQVCYKTVT